MDNLEQFYEAIPISIIGYVIVFTVLLILYIVFFYLAKLLEAQAKGRFKKTSKKSTEIKGDFTISGEVSAAIGMALYLHFSEKHDIETGKLTMKPVSKRYTPWNSKIYNVMNRL